MRAALLPKSNVSFSALEPLLASVEEPLDAYVNGGKPYRKKKKKKGHQQHHQRGSSIADRVWNRLKGETNNAEQHHEDGDKDEENDKLSDLHQQHEQQVSPLDGNNNVGLPVMVGESYTEPVDFMKDPVRNIPDQLATEPES